MPAPSIQSSTFKLISNAAVVLAPAGDKPKPAQPKAKKQQQQQKRKPAVTAIRKATP
jgi:hypothetical protein